VVLAELDSEGITVKHFFSAQSNISSVRSRHPYPEDADALPYLFR
jgi:hypothetical protein